MGIWVLFTTLPNWSTTVTGLEFEIPSASMSASGGPHHQSCAVVSGNPYIRSESCTTTPDAPSMRLSRHVRTTIGPRPTRALMSQCIMLTDSVRVPEIYLDPPMDPRHHQGFGGTFHGCRSKGHAPGSTPDPGRPVHEQVLEVVRLVRGHIRAGEADLYQKVTSAVERVVLAEVLRHVGGNQVRASEILGIARNTLRSKLRAAGLAVEKQVGFDPGQDGQ